MSQVKPGFKTRAVGRNRSGAAMERTEETARKAKSTIRQWIFLVAGNIFVGLGVVGIFLPLVPTTPFLLLAASCYLRSSEKCYAWLIHNRWLGKYIRNYREGKGIPLRGKIIAISLLWLAIGYSIFFVVDLLLVRVVLVLIAAGVTLHLLHLPTMRSSESRATDAKRKPPLNTV